MGAESVSFARFDDRGHFVDFGTAVSTTGSLMYDVPTGERVYIFQLFAKLTPPSPVVNPCRGRRSERRAVILEKPCLLIPQVCQRLSFVLELFHSEKTCPPRYCSSTMICKASNWSG
jgi:hypothetical protein